MDADSRPKWERLARLLAERRARIDPRYAIRKVFAEEVNVHSAVLRDIENAARDNYTPPTIAAIEVAYRLEPGSIQCFLDGGELVEQAPLGFETTAEWPALGVQASNSTTLTATPSITTRRSPPWFSSEVERRGWTQGNLTIDQLKALASHFGYTVAGLMLDAGLVTEQDLEIDEQPAPPSRNEALAEFDAAAQQIASSPFLSHRERKRIEEHLARAREEAIRNNPEGT